MLTALVAGCAALVPRLTFAIPFGGVASGIVYVIAVVISWKRRDRQAEADTAYGIFYVRYKVLGVDGIREAFVKAEPRLARRIFK